MGQMQYDTKSDDYFHGERRDFIDHLPVGRYNFLEIGSGDGANARYARAAGKVATYVGVELFQSAADKSKPSMDRLYVGDVEKLDLAPEDGPFDVVIMSEVLEHLADPWAVLHKVRSRVSPEAYVFASSPAISHYTTIKMLIRGDWELADFGRMDRTHLRWFTPTTYARMFADTGFTVEAVRRQNVLTPKQRFFERLLPARYHHLFTAQISLYARPAPSAHPEAFRPSGRMTRKA